jgi:type I restriction enzyme S subunit
MPDAALKNSWHMRRFDEMAVVVNDRIDDPSEAGVDRYVGLEHLDSDSLTIRRWGSPDDVEATKLRFRAGDIIFGRRRVYQRKLGVADFDGICSAHAMVLRAKPAIALPEFLPFFMQSDHFMERAKEISVGSLSPTINWKTLAKEEFALPPLEEQRRLVEILEGIRDLEERAWTLLDSLRVTRESWLEQEFSMLARRWPEKVASDLMERITVGIVVKPADLYVPRGEGIPALRSLNIVPDKVVMEDLVYISPDGHAAHQKSRLTSGDVVIVRTGRPGDAAVVPTDAGELNCIDLIICGLSPELVPQFLCAAINSRFGRRQFAAGTAGTAQKHFNVGAFKGFKVPVPPMDVQSRFVDKLHDFAHLVTEAERRLEGVRRVRLDLMRRAFQA